MAIVNSKNKTKIKNNNDIGVPQNITEKTTNNKKFKVHKDKGTSEQENKTGSNSLLRALKDTSSTKKETVQETTEDTSIKRGPRDTKTNAKSLVEELRAEIHNNQENNRVSKKTGQHLTLIEISQAGKSFRVGGQDVAVLKEINFDINEGEFLVIFGPSGSGKSTLLHLLLGLEAPSEGKVNFLGEDMYALENEDARSELRKKYFGMVFQQPNWIKALNVIENIAFPLQLLGTEKERALERAHSLLEKLGLGDWSHYYPTELSSGQQQRVSLVRAIIHNPIILVADEPTGNLDYDTGQTIMTLLKELNEQEQKTIIMVTHDLEYLDFAKTAVEIFDGQMAGIYRGEDKEKLREKISMKLKRGVKSV